jgi:NADH-quinone oxidoreductase subunit L
MIANPWLIPLVPALAFAFILFFGVRLRWRGAEVGIGAMAVTTVMSIWALIEFAVSDRSQVNSSRDWFSLDGFTVSAGVVTDGLSTTMLVLVSFISLIVQIYSTNYMADDRRYTHFFAIMTLFTASMQWFVISSNTLQVIFGWEVMSLCSFLLIGHWWEEKHNVHAAMKAFLTTRASDVGLFVGVIVLFFAAGRTFEIDMINNAAMSGDIADSLLLIAAAALFISVVGKSAQFPLHTWLPDAMAGPTPMSALIHAATMVVAGVYLMARMFPVFAEAFSIGDLGGMTSSVNPIAIIGALTIVIAALLAFVQSDIKKLLSYSTVSQLGFMVMAIGVGAWVAAVFHVVCHAFSKALLFLSSGSVSHAVHGFDIDRDMGGLKKPMPVTHATFAIGAASLVGIVPLAGFWSKEQIIAQAGANGYVFFQAMALLGTFLTVAYMLRCYVRIFLGSFRGSGRPHESPRTLTIPCAILAVGTVVVGFVHAPIIGLDPFGTLVTPYYLDVPQSDAHDALPLLIEIALVALAVAIGAYAIEKKIGPRHLADKFAGVRAAYHVLYNRLYLDWLYDKVFVGGIKKVLAWVVQWLDHNVVDRSVDSLGSAATGLGRLVVNIIDKKIVDGAVVGAASTTDSAGRVLSAAHSGQVGRYLLAMVTGVVVLMAVIVAGA